MQAWRKRELAEVKAKNYPTTLSKSTANNRKLAESTELAAGLESRIFVFREKVVNHQATRSKYGLLKGLVGNF